MSLSQATAPYGARLAESLIPLLQGALAVAETPAGVSIDNAGSVGLLLIVRMYVPPADAACFEERWRRGDAVVRRATAQMGEMLLAQLDALQAACRQEREFGQWVFLIKDSSLLAMAAASLGNNDVFFLSLCWEGLAAARLDWHTRAVEQLKRALVLNVENQQETYAWAHETLGDELAIVEEFGAATVEYDQALKQTKDVAGAWRILRKQATLLGNQGEFRRAANIYANQMQALKAGEVSKAEEAFTLDMWAGSLVGFGDAKAAVQMLEKARDLLKDGAKTDQLINACLRQGACASLGDEGGTASAFAEAHELAFQIAREEISPERYKAGLAAAARTLLPLSHKAWQLVKQGAAQLAAGKAERCLAIWDEASAVAAASGDAYVSLWVAANAVATCMDIGKYDDAFAKGTEVRRLAREYAFARPEALATTTLASLAQSSGDLNTKTPAIALAARAATLLQMEKDLPSPAGGEPVLAMLRGEDTGNVDSVLAMAAEEAGHDGFVLQYYESAVAKGRAAGMRFELINRLCGLHKVQRRQWDEEAPARTAAEIELLLKADDTPLRARIVGERTLGTHYASSDLRTATVHMQAAMAAIEMYRQQLELPSRRGFDREFQDVPKRLAEFLRKQGEYEAAFNALQLSKGRVLIETLNAAQAGRAQDLDKPPSLKEVQALLGALDASTVLLDFAVTGTGIVTYCVTATDLKVLLSEGSYTEFTGVQFGDVEERDADTVEATVQSPLLGDLTRTVMTAIPACDSVMVVPDNFLNNLALHAVPVDDAPWGELMSFSYIPAAAMLRFMRPHSSGMSVLLAGDSVNDLSGAKGECSAIGTLFGSQPLLGSDCTISAVTEALKQRPDIVHLAVHGRADVSNGTRSALLFAGSETKGEWLEIDALASQTWGARLVVLSGCSTGVVGYRHMTDMLSAPLSLLEAGATTVIASLWPVGDELAERVMTTFYQRLHARAVDGAPVDLRKLLGGIQNEVRRQRGGFPVASRHDVRLFRPLGSNDAKMRQRDAVTKAAMAWAPFCIFGSPIYG